MRDALTIVRESSRIFAWLGGGAIIVTAFVVSADVLFRNLFRISLNIGVETSSYVLAISTAWAFSYALVQHSHVRVDAAVRLLPKRIAAWADLLALAALAWYAVLLLWHGGVVLATSWSFNSKAMTPLATPLWIPQGLWVVGLGLFALVCLILLFQSLGLLVRGDYARSRELIGMASVEEEAESEIASLSSGEKG